MRKHLYDRYETSLVVSVAEFRVAFNRLGFEAIPEEIIHLAEDLVVLLTNFMVRQPNRSTNGDSERRPLQILLRACLC